MKILVTGSQGFVGRNLVAQLRNIQEGKNKSYSLPTPITAIYEYDIDNTPQQLDEYCKDCTFVFNLAGVNRPKDQAEFMAGNFGFASLLLDALKRHNNTCPVMISSSTQAALDNPYGESKRAGEQLIQQYGHKTGARTLIYRFPNLFGKWCRPNYNSGVATFCHNIANDLEITVSDRSYQMTLVYIDDLVDEMIAALAGKENRVGDYCEMATIHTATLGEIVDLLYQFAEQPKSLMMPEIPNNSFAKKLYSTYLSYLPKHKASFDLKMNIDPRGSFTELLKTASNGQFSVNVSLPGITKGQHWHNSKWEFFIVVSGTALIQQRKIGTDEILNFQVSGDKIQAVHMLPGYTHNIINTSTTENLVTLMWANEPFDPAKPDTFFQEV